MASPDPVESALGSIDEARAELGAVHLVGVIGSPIGHSLSPVLHNAAFAALGLETTWRSRAFEVASGQAASALTAMRRADVKGLSVTMPHKADVSALVDDCSQVARRLGAVNCVVNREGRLFGTNTDGEGFVASLVRGAGFTPAGRRCLVIGAGGAARAVILGLAEAGASEVAVLNRTPERAAAAAALAGVAGSVVAPGPTGSAEHKGPFEAVDAADLVVNATPLGMAGAFHGSAADWLVAPQLLHPGQVVADLVYAPRPTRWLAEAAAAGARPVDGLGMLVHQAAAQLQLWTGQEAPVEAMWEAAEAVDPPKPPGIPGA